MADMRHDGEKKRKGRKRMGKKEEEISQRSTVDNDEDDAVSR